MTTSRTITRRSHRAVFDAAVLPPLADRLREQQRLFDRTAVSTRGPLHRAGSSSRCARTSAGTTPVDKGRRRAVLDRTLLDGDADRGERRAGYELVQKPSPRGIPMLVAVGAPSTLAVATAVRFGLTLVDSCAESAFNVTALRNVSRVRSMERERDLAVARLRSARSIT